MSNTRIHARRPEAVSTMRLRPRCEQPGCDGPATYQYQYEDGTYRWRTRHGLFVCGSHQRQPWHPYLRFRKDYCENRDSRLGFICTSNIVWAGMLDVDHINGDPSDNRERNLQTLCKNCHAFKTSKNGDHLTPGRGTLQTTW